MLKKVTLAGLAASVLLFSGCAVNPTRAIVYSNTIAPYHATEATAGEKVGKSDTCTNILGLIATGDCSISNAAKKGGITSISSVDWEGTNILGIYTTGRTIVRGK